MTFLCGIGLIGSASCVSDFVCCILDAKRSLISLVQRLKNQAIYSGSNKETTHKAWHDGRNILIYIDLENSEGVRLQMGLMDTRLGRLPMGAADGGS